MSWLSSGRITVNQSRGASPSKSTKLKFQCVQTASWRASAIAERRYLHLGGLVPLLCLVLEKCLVRKVVPLPGIWEHL